MRGLRQVLAALPIVVVVLVMAAGGATVFELDVELVAPMTPTALRWALVVVAVGVCSVGLVTLGIALAGREERRAKHLAAALEAEAQLETARAIREVTRDLDPSLRWGREDFPAESPVARGQTAVGKDRPSPPEPPWEELVAAVADLKNERGVRIEQAGGIAGAVDRFYADALLQSRVWFLASVLAAVVGLGVIVWEVLLAGNQPAVDAGLKVASAALAGAIAVLFYRQSDATRKHAADLLTSTQSDRQAETARQILGTIQDVERREELKGRLAMHLAGAAPAPRRRSARSARPEGAADRSPQPAPAVEAEQRSVE